jgi:hypothetical protein
MLCTRAGVPRAAMVGSNLGELSRMQARPHSRTRAAAAVPGAEGFEVRARRDAPLFARTPQARPLSHRTATPTRAPPPGLHGAAAAAHQGRRLRQLRG